jgi:hypothetical protein
MAVTTKARIEATEGARPSLDVMFNPKELSIDKGVPWKKHDASEADQPIMEYTASDPKTLACELTFDGYEQRASVKGHVDTLESMMLVDKELKRPPMVTFTWGTALQTFQGVITKLGVKYTMFLGDGTPVRATVSFAMTQAAKAVNKAEGKALTEAEAKKQKKGQVQQAGAKSRPDAVAAQSGQTTPAGTPDQRKVMEKNNADSAKDFSKPGSTVVV